MTQFQLARAGIVSPEMELAAGKELRDAEFIRARVAEGKIVIPANRNHTNLSAIGIGRELLTKINANLGNSALSGSADGESSKLQIALRFGADTVMDLSTGSDVAAIRKNLLAVCPAPVGTVPIYETVARFGAAGLNRDNILRIIREQAVQGVDYMTIHAGFLKRLLPAAMKRKMKIVSRGGSLIARLMAETGCENPFYEAFDEILKICLEYDVTLSLGDGLRPGCLADASDNAQFGELEELGKLVRRCRDAGVQAMVEGPGHVPMDQIEKNMKLEQKLCGDAPFYILGPVVIDCAPGYDHLTAAMGGMLGAFYGAAMLCYVTPKEHLGLPDADDVRRGVVAFKIAAHAADIGLHKPGAMERDNAISDARAKFDWEGQFHFAMDPERAREYRGKALSVQTHSGPVGDARFCTMCGPDFCAVRISAAIDRAMSGKPD